MSARICQDCGLERHCLECHYVETPHAIAKGALLVDERRYRALERIAAQAALVEENYQGVRHYQTASFASALDALRQAHLDLLILESR